MMPTWLLFADTYDPPTQWPILFNNKHTANCPPKVRQDSI